MTAAASVGTGRYRMKDLCDLTGLPRQVIHFYIQQGLVPAGQKTGRNMAYYTDQHVERIRLVRQLQHERFLPLRAIRALFDDQDEQFSPVQRQFLVSVKQKLAQSLSAADKPHTVDAQQVVKGLGLAMRDLQQMIECDMIVTIEGADGRARLAKDNVWLLEMVARLRRIGFTPELGFDVADLAIYEEAISALFDKERRLLERLTHLSPELVASMIERAIAVVHEFIVRYHEAKIRNFVAAL